MQTMRLEGNWVLTRIKDNSSCPISIPGDICSALLKHGLIQDPFVGRHELALQWIGQEDWLLERTFVLSTAPIQAQRLILRFDCLDTVADIMLNGQLLAQTANMFIPLSIDITPHALAGENRLAVRIRSPEKAAAALAKTYDCEYPASLYPVHSPHRNLLRKAQYMSGWDWGPCLMTGGIYGKVWLEYAEQIRVLGCDLSTTGRGDNWTVAVSLQLEAIRPGQYTYTISVGESANKQRLNLTAGRHNCLLELQVANPALWWPRGHGDQSLHEVRISIADETGATVAQFTRTIGFRDVQIDTTNDQAGKAMTIRVNGQPIFAKGANWIPSDALPSRWDFAGAKPLLDAALDANMNMLRVWGGGRYESEEFYEYCDQHGLMVWQDFMFGCATYPADPAFLSTVEQEAIAQIRRIGHHPSIMLWCGNNEDLGAINWFEASRNSPARYLVAYDRLNEGVLGRLVRELDPNRPWWPSSPSAGPDDYSDNWHSDNSGDMHYWAVWHEGKPFSAYQEIRPRFCSEFGFQSFPSQACLARAVPAEEMNITSPVMEHHQRHPRGNELILTTMLRYFRMPKGFAETLYLSQVQQAMAIKTAVDFWRSTMPRCMGTLYWQLNDVWPCASWSSLEYGGGYKLLHHEARRFYASCTPLIIIKDGTIHVHVVNEEKSAESALLRVQLRKLSGGVVLDEALPLKLPVGSAKEFWQRNLNDLPLEPEELLLLAELVPADNSQPDRAEIPAAWSLLCDAKRCNLPQPELAISDIRPDAAGIGYRISLSCQKPALNIQLQYRQGEGLFSDGNFLLLPGETRTISWKPLSGQAVPDLEAFRGGLSLMHLRASYD